MKRKKGYLVSLPVDKELHCTIADTAEQYHISRADVVRTALRGYFGIKGALRVRTNKRLSKSLDKEQYS